MEKSRVQKFIALSGIYSRRKAQELIAKGQVTVNGKKVSLGDHCYPTDDIRINRKKIHFKLNDKTYYIMNKKKGIVCTRSDELKRKTIFDILKSSDKIKNLFSVGRLDKNTTGLIILTNDGEFAQKVIHPSAKISKEYIAISEKPLDNKSQKILENGIFLDGHKLSSCKINKITDNKYKIQIWEGKKRQIRRMFENVGNKISKLERIRIGGLHLKDLRLKEGEYKKVAKKELEKEIFKKKQTD